MTVPQTLPAPGAGDTAPAGSGIRLSGVVRGVFADRGEPLVGWSAQLMDGVIGLHGLPVAGGTLAARRGNSFITLSTRLLDGLGPGARERLGELDGVFLAYRTPDLFSYDVAGCYLAEHLPGTPVPLAVADQGAGAPFTALGIAHAMAVAGRLGRGVLFVYDQRAGGWPAPGEADVPEDTDAAVLLVFGAGEGGAADGPVLSELREEPVVAVRPALEALAERHPTARIVAGGALLAAVGEDVAQWGGRVVGPPDGHHYTGPWAALAGLWPLAGPVVLAEYEPVTGRLHSCLFSPSSTQGATA